VVPRAARVLRDPRGAAPTDPSQDPQYAIWEAAIQDWIRRGREANPNWQIDFGDPPTEYDDVHVLGTVLLHSEKRDDPAWEDPVRAWAEANGYAYPSQEAIQDASTSTSIIFP